MTTEITNTVLEFSFVVANIKIISLLSKILQLFYKIIRHILENTCKCQIIYVSLQ